MKNLPEVFVDFHWDKTINFINWKLEHDGEFILYAKNHRMGKESLKSVLRTLSKDWKQKKKWIDGDEVKVHLMRIGVGEE